MACDPIEKASQATALYQDMQSAYENDRHWQPSNWETANRIETPGKPDQPELVHPSQVARRRLGSESGRAALVHAIAHIEFNAINLALDAVYRFANMPVTYYLDWASVASDEARHFTMLKNRLEEMNAHYGQLTAHNGLWEMALKTDHNCLQRMALVPRVLEARGLDVTPAMINKLNGQGDDQTTKLLNIILKEEIGHVDIGTRWFHWCCQQEGKEPETTFMNLMKTHMSHQIKGPLNEPARLQAGFSEAELTALNKMIS